MAARKKTAAKRKAAPAAKPDQPGINIIGCTLTGNSTPQPLHVATAIIGIARACEETASALKEAALALQQQPGITTGIKIGGNNL